MYIFIDDVHSLLFYWKYLFIKSVYSTSDFSDEIVYFYTAHIMVQPKGAGRGVYRETVWYSSHYLILIIKRIMKPIFLQQHYWNNYDTTLSCLVQLKHLLTKIIRNNLISDDRCWKTTWNINIKSSRTKCMYSIKHHVIKHTPDL